MTNHDVQLFNFQDSSIRVIPGFKDGQTYFVAKDVATALGYGVNAVDPQARSRALHKAVTQYCPNEVSLAKRDVSPNLGETLFRAKESSLKVIPESDIYQLVMRSYLPSARDFQDWVCGTVLPAIRKDGAYVKDEEKVVSGEMDEDEFILKAVAMLQAKVDRLKADKEKAEGKVEELSTELEKMTLRQWEVDVRRGYLSKSEKGRLSGKLRDKVVERHQTTYEGHKTSINVYMKADINEAAKGMGLI